MTRHCEFRFVKRNGAVTQQRRYVTYKTKVVTPWWKFWEHDLDMETTYGEWADIEIPELNPDFHKKELVQCQKYFDSIGKDPVKYCEVYKREGCSHVDGPLCDFPNCSIRLSDLQKKILDIKVEKNDRK